MSPDKKQEFIDKVANGLSGRAACKEMGIAYTTVWKALKADDAFDNQYALARDLRTEVIEDQIMIIGDAETGPHKLKDGTPIGETMEQRRLQIDARKWLLGKMNKRYSERIIHSNDPESPMPAGTVINQTMTVKEAAESYAGTINDSES